MIKYIIIIALFILIVIKIKNKLKIKYKTFFNKGYRVSNTPYGIYCYHGKQGSTKTQNAVSYLLENKNKRIYANLKSLKGIHYKYYSGFNTLLEIGTNESDCIIFYDELFKGLFKGKKMSEKDKQVLMDFMSQMRKRNIILITTAQEWLEIPIEFRRYVRFDIKCRLISIFGIPIIVKLFNDTEQIRWSQEDNEYISPRIETIIEHGRKKIVNSYDTFEQIKSDEINPIDMFNELTYNEYKIPHNEAKNTELEEVKENDKLSMEISSDISEEIEVESVNQPHLPYTTTNKEDVVNRSFDEQVDKFKNINIIDTSANFNNIDNDFWENISDDDFEQNVK